MARRAEKKRGARRVEAAARGERRRHGGEAPGVARVIALKLTPCKNTPSKRVPTRRGGLVSSLRGFSATRSRERISAPAVSDAVVRQRAESFRRDVSQNKEREAAK